MSPQNPHALSLPQSHDFSKSTVTRLILEAKLAPFYRGIEDFEEDWTLDQISEEIDKVREKDVEEGVANSVTERIKEERAPPTSSTGVGSLAKKVGANINRHRNEERGNREKDERAAQLDREKRAYLNATECPICFLVRPSPAYIHLTVRQSDQKELPTQYQYLALLPTTNLYRMLCPDQTVRSYYHPSRIRTRLLPVLHGNRFRGHLRTAQLAFACATHIVERCRHGRDGFGTFDLTGSRHQWDQPGDGYGRD